MNGERGLNGRIRTAHEKGTLYTDRHIVILEFTKALKSTTGVFAFGQRFTWNYAYDVDATLGSAAIPGFSEYAAMYGYYRVLRGIHTVRITNLETFSVFAMLQETNQDPGASPSNPPLQSGRPHRKWVEIAPAGDGASQKTLVMKVHGNQILGSNAIQASSEFRGTPSGSVPVSDTLWSTLSAEAVNTANMLTNGLEIVHKIKIWIEFYSIATNVVSVGFFDRLSWHRTRYTRNAHRILGMIEKEAQEMAKRGTFESMEQIYQQLWKHYTNITVKCSGKYVTHSPSISLLVAYLTKDPSLDDMISNVVDYYMMHDEGIRSLVQSTYPTVMRLVPLLNSTEIDQSKFDPKKLVVQEEKEQKKLAFRPAPPMQ